MMKTMILTTLAIALSGTLLVPGQQSAPTTHLKVGDPAPEFSLRDQNGQPVSLSDFKGKKNVVLAFYVLAFTPG